MSESWSVSSIQTGCSLNHEGAKHTKMIERAVVPLVDPPIPFGLF